MRVRFQFGRPPAVEAADKSSASCKTEYALIRLTKYINLHEVLIDVLKLADILGTLCGFSLFGRKPE